MSLIHKAFLLIQTSNAMKFNDNLAPPEPTYKGGVLYERQVMHLFLQFRKSQKRYEVQF